MTFPIYAGKHTQQSTPLVTPERFAEHLRERGLLEGYVAPEGIVLLYARAFARALLEREPHRSAGPYPGQLHLLDRFDGRVGVMAFYGIGAPAAAAVVDLLASLGTRRFLNLGAAGGLQPGARVGELVVCTNAVRDEGVSHHYLPPARYASPSPRLTNALMRRLTAAECSFRVGSTWTIDAPFRETVEELRHYRDEGVLTVEMEAAAVFAVAERRGFEAAAAFVLSDMLSDADWTPDFGSPEIQRGLTVLVDAAIEVIEAH
ncbi:MAG TPA: purine phosphorylase [Chloroflexota bacterium]|nr:purine phosphorylase [Chloroflexota bacterium]